jgi:formate hydrogenlyase subunit 6/NADH:ubiquinone oxidoreductase subunit I
MKGSAPFLRRLPALIRGGLAVLVLGAFFYAYLSSTLKANEVLTLVLKGQFSPALYGAGITAAAVLGILALSLIFGRVFCSVLCPLGTLQELFWRAGNFLRGRLRGGKKGRPPARGTARSAYRTAPGIRWAVPLLTGLALAFSFSPLMAAFDPLSNFGRGLGALRAPGGGNPVPLVLALPFVLILVLAFFRGREWCAWCPAGLTLGLLSPAAPLGMRISPRCVSCGICGTKCPAACIDPRGKRIDSGRCVLCFSCAAVCPTGGVSYGPRGKAALSGGPRRLFLKAAGRASLLCGAAYLAGPSLRLFSLAAPGAAGTAGGPILPPGALNEGQYRARCIACQACAAACPAGIIAPRRSLRPTLDYRNAGCQYNCVECGKVCPTGAIRRLDAEEKHRTRIALSSLSFERCVVNTKRESCGACAEVCPTGAITMTAYGESGIPWLTRPVFEEQYCIGCGACYAACPAEPRALSIEAVAEQSLTAGVRPAGEGGEGFVIENLDDFPF